jgi:hypothetical protein
VLSIRNSQAKHRSEKYFRQELLAGNEMKEVLVQGISTMIALDSTECNVG